MTMRCTKCGKPTTKVTNSRVQKDGLIRRRRECLSCGARFTTVEYPVERKGVA